MADTTATVAAGVAAMADVAAAEIAEAMADVAAVVAGEIAAGAAAMADAAAAGVVEAGVAGEDPAEIETADATVEAALRATAAIATGDSDYLRM